MWNDLNAWVLDGQLLLSVHPSIHWPNHSSISVSLLAPKHSENFPLNLLILFIHLLNYPTPCIHPLMFPLIQTYTTHSQVYLFIYPYLPIQLPILLFTYPPGHPSIHPSIMYPNSIVHPLIYLPIHQSNHLSIHLLILLFIYHYTQPSVNIFTELLTHPSVYLFIHPDF